MGLWYILCLLVETDDDIDDGKAAITYEIDGDNDESEGALVDVNVVILVILHGAWRRCRQGP